MKDANVHYLAQYEQREQEREVIEEAWRKYYVRNLIDQLTPEEVSEAFSETSCMLEFIHALQNRDAKRLEEVSRGIMFEYWLELKIAEAIETGNEI